MNYLELRSVSARWIDDETTLGHSKESPVTLSAEPGDWIAIVGINGVGKSTLLHAVAGTVNYVAGSISVLDQELSPKDVIERFEVGVQFVPQQESLHDNLTFEDAVNLVRYHRPALYNEKAIDGLMETMITIGIIDENKVLSPRMFDLTCAILSVPRILALDEIMPAWSGTQNRKDAYKWIQNQLPRTTVLFTEHNIDTALDVGSHVLILEPGDRVPVFSKITEETRELVSDTLTIETEDIDESEHIEPRSGDWQRIADLERPVISELRLALLVAFPGESQKRKKREQEILDDFHFLSTNRSVSTLSGGQRTVLQWFMLKLSGLGQLPATQLGHLDQDNRECLRKNWGGINDEAKSNSSDA
jgi:ABC-type branched-subunit amino acid transport system ATPase component